MVSAHSLARHPQPRAPARLVQLPISLRRITLAQRRVVGFAGESSLRFRAVGGRGLVLGLPWPLRKQDSVRA